MKQTFIYVLKDPRTGEVRYLGKSDNPRERFLAHLGGKDRESTHKRNWVLGLKKLGLFPSLEILDEVPESQWAFWEQEYIRVFRMIGIRLTNGTAGGDGRTEFSEETRKQVAKSRRGKKYRNNQSGFVGVSWHRQDKKWRARIVNPVGKEIFLGLFDELELAARAYDRAAKQFFGVNTPLNFPEIL